MPGYGKRQAKESLNHTFGKTPDTTPVGVIYVAMNTGDPGEDGQTANEASGGSYARVLTAASDWNAATDATPSVTSNANAVAFATATADWSAGADMTNFSLWKSLSGTTEADYIGTGTLEQDRAVLDEDDPEFGAGTLKMTMS